MKLYKFFLFSVAAAVTFTATAQLSDMKVVSVELAGANTDPGYDLNKKPMARIEITASGGVDGLTVVDNGDAKPAKKISDGKSVYADAVAEEFFKARYLTIYHPDCKPLNLEFESYEATQDIEWNKTYRVTLSMPSAALVAANKAFDNLELEEARRLYDKVSEAGEMEIVASRRSLLAEIQPTVEAALKLEKSPVKTDRVKSMLLFENIARRTGSTEAGLRSRKLRAELVPGRENENQGKGISKMMLSKFVPDVNNTTFRTRNTGAINKDSFPTNVRERMSLIIATIPLSDVKFDAGDDLVAQDYDNGLYYVVLKAGDANKVVPLKISHPMFEDMVLQLGKGAMPKPAPFGQFVLELSVPPVQIVEGDMLFNGMDFDLAAKVYRSVDRSLLDDRQLSLLDRRLDACYSLQPYSDAYNELRDVVNSPGEMVDRRLMIKSIDLILTYLAEMEKNGVSSAKSLSQRYRSLRSDYTDLIHLSLKVDKEQKTSKGIKMNPFRTRILYVSLKDGNNDTVILKARPVPDDEGRYSVFLPENWSGKLRSGKSLKLKMSDSEMIKGENVSDELTLTPKSDNGETAMNYSVSLIIKK